MHGPPLVQLVLNPAISFLHRSSSARRMSFSSSTACMFSSALFNFLVRVVFLPVGVKLLDILPNLLFIGLGVVLGEGNAAEGVAGEGGGGKNLKTLHVVADRPTGRAIAVSCSVAFRVWAPLPSALPQRHLCPSRQNQQRSSGCHLGRLALLVQSRLLQTIPPVRGRRRFCPVKKTTSLSFSATSKYG